MSMDITMETIIDRILMKIGSFDLIRHEDFETEIIASVITDILTEIGYSNTEPSYEDMHKLLLHMFFTGVAFGGVK